MNDKKKEEMFKEQRFPYLNMSIEERDFCIEILKNCKDISDSDNKVDGTANCDLVQMKFSKEDDGSIHANGVVSIGNNKPENRCIDADIFISNSSIIVDMLVTRLMVEDKNKEYRVLDEFKYENNVLRRKSLYNYDMKNLYENIDNEKMKGRLK